MAPQYEPRYEKVRGARFTAESVGQVERFTIRPPRSLLVAGFLSVLGVVMAGVGASAVTMMSSVLRPPSIGFDRYVQATLYACIVVVVVALAVGLSSLLLPLLWMVGGAEILEVADGDLAVTHRVLGFARTRRYKGDDIGDVAGHVAPPLQQGQGSIPFLRAARNGSVRVTYGARTVYLAQDLDVAEGRLLAAALKESLRSVGPRRRSTDEP